MRKWLGLAVCLTVGCAAVPATAAEVRLAWDENPAAEQVTAYKIYQDGVAVATVPAAQCTAGECQGAVTVAPGAYTYTVTANNLWGLESEPSAPVSTPPAATAPANARVTVTVTVTVGK